MSHLLNSGGALSSIASLLNQILAALWQQKADWALP